MALSSHAELIKRRLTNLIDNTYYSVRLIDRCVEKYILTQDRADSIRNEVDVYEQKRLLYTSIQLIDTKKFDELIQIMKEDETKQSEILLNILKLCPFHLKNQGVWFNVPSRNDSFIGRKNEMKLLHENITRNSGNESEVSVFSQLTSISGLGGIGKTSMAIRYAYEYADFFDENVIWINGFDTSSMQNSFKDLAIKIGVTVEHGINLTENTINKIYEYFSTCKCLFIFDNVSEYFGGVDFFLPILLQRNAITPFILMTTRKRILINSAVSIELEGLKPNDAHEFIRTELKIETNENIELVQKLAFKLQYLPLALKQAVSYIRVNLRDRAIYFENNEDPIQSYLSKFETEKTRAVVADVIKLLGFEHYKNDSNDIYKETVLSTWVITLDEIMKQKQVGPFAREIINLMAYFNPHAIKSTTFHKKYSKDDAEDAILMLMNYSMINFNENEFKIKINSLVQTVVRENNKDKENETQEILKGIDNFIPFYCDDLVDGVGPSLMNRIVNNIYKMVIR